MGHFGSVALSANGEVALVGARGEGDYLECLFCGAAYVFVREGDAWVERQRLTASDAKALDRFGGGKLSANGEVAFIGGGGATYVFVREGDVWVERQKLIPPLAISASGEVALAGAPGEDCTAVDPQCGAAYVFVREGDAWVERQKLTASDAKAFERFGAPIALSTRVEVVLIGAFDDPCTVGEEEFNCGAAYVFVREGDVWVERQKLTGRRKHPLTINFGISVALSASGERALVGTNGKTFVFVREVSTWVKRQRLSAGPVAALSANGKRVLVGWPNYSCTGGHICGAVDVFRE
jgi:hypothetical protein